MNKQKIALLTDSGSDVPADLVEKYGMYKLSLKIIYTDREYIDGVDITAKEVYDNLKKEIPKTSLPSGEEIEKVFQQILADGYEKVIVVTISSGISGTHNAIRLMAEKFKTLDVFMVDTLNIAIGSGFSAIQAAKYIEEDLDWETIKLKLTQNISKSKVFFCIGTLEYLQKGGRIGLVASVLGSALNLKPIISCNEAGVYYNIAKVRGRQKSLAAVIELASEYAKASKKYNIALIEGDAEEEALVVKEQLLAKIPNPEAFYFGSLGPGLGVHTGPGLIGIAVQLLD